jgi:hypothetical protein
MDEYAPKDEECAKGEKYSAHDGDHPINVNTCCPSKDEESDWEPVFLPASDHNNKGSFGDIESVSPTPS